MKRVIASFLLIVLVTALCGCKAETTKNEKMKDLEFTVVENVDVPEELMKTIEDKKANPFKLSFGDDEFLYIVEGFGEQNTGGYSIQVTELYESSNAIYFHATLQGPSKNEELVEAKSYPYVVIKTELIDKSIVFK